MSQVAHDTAQEIPLAPDGMRPDIKYFFIGGTRKSGTTWLTKMLDSHPEIHCCGEAFIVSNPQLGRSVTQWINEEAIRSWFQFPAVAGWCRDRGITIDETIHLAQRAAGEAILRRGAVVPDEKRPHIKFIGEKSPFAYCAQADLLHQTFPDSVFIHILRDGRDMTVSDMFMTLNIEAMHQRFTEEQRIEVQRIREWFIEGKGEPVKLLPDYVVEEEARIWRNCYLASKRAKQIYGDKFIEYRYEDLLTEPERLGECFELIGATNTPEILRACIEKNTFRAMSGGRASGDADQSSMVRKGIHGDWKNHFTDSNKAVFKEICGDLLIETGYEKDLDW